MTIASVAAELLSLPLPTAMPSTSSGGNPDPHINQEPGAKRAAQPVLVGMGGGPNDVKAMTSVDLTGQPIAPHRVVDVEVTIRFACGVMRQRPTLSMPWTAVTLAQRSLIEDGHDYPRNNRARGQVLLKNPREHTKTEGSEGS